MNLKKKTLESHRVSSPAAVALRLLAADILVLIAGVLVKRHHIPNGKDQFFTVVDLACGSELTFYGRTFRVVDCDGFTAEFFHENGVQPALPPISTSRLIPSTFDDDLWRLSYCVAPSLIICSV